MLALELWAWWFNEASVCHDFYGSADRDVQLDELITDLIGKRKEAGHRWAWKAELDRLEEEAKMRVIREQNGDCCNHATR